MNSILERSKQMPYYTDLKLIFEAFHDRQKDYNWLITDLECNHYPDSRIPYPCPHTLWFTGDELTNIVEMNSIQFIWGVISGFAKEREIDVNDLSVYPYADGNPDFWVTDPKIQHPLAQVEVVCWDSTSTLLLSKDMDLSLKFRMYFTDAIDLNEYNAVK